MLAVLMAILTVIIGPATLWSGEQIPSERIEGVTAQGVQIRQSFEAGSIAESTLIPWVEVRSIGNSWSGAERYEEVADSLKRAEDRLARGDASGAGRLLEPLAETYFGEPGPTTSQVASALVMIRMLDGDSEGALNAWLVWRGQRGGPDRAWIDSATGLCPALPPVFRRANEVGAENTDRGDPVAASDVMRFVYSIAAMNATEPRSIDLGEIERGPQDRADLGVRMVWDIVRANTDPDPSARRAARDAIDRRGRAARSEWEIAWAHLAVGVSQMGESDRLLRDAGAARLVSVIIEHPKVAPGLSDLTRDLLIEYFEETDRPHHVASVRALDRAALLGLAQQVGSDGSALETEQGAASPTDGTPSENP